MSIRNRLVWRSQRPGDPPRAYANFRDFADVGGTRRVALIPEGQKRATTDPDIATQLLADKLEEFEKKRRGQALEIVEEPLDSYVAHHLLMMAKNKENSPEWIDTLEKMLGRAIEFFTAKKDIKTIGPKDLTKWVNWLRTQRTINTDKPYSEATIRHHLNALSGMYARAISDEVTNTNPVQQMYSKPVPDSEESPWLEVHEAARYLEAIRSYELPYQSIPYLYALVGTFLLTGGRQAEIFGLERKDVSFARNVINIRPNKWRRLKTKRSARIVPLWPQLRDILQAHIDTLPDCELLFPVYLKGKEQPITDIRKSLDIVSESMEDWDHKIRTKVFRHTYCAARLQTLDRGEPVTVFTVSRELGHVDTSLVERVYGHLGEVRYRSDVVEYRV